MKSLKWKLVLIYVALVFIASTISGTFIIMRLQAQENEKIQYELTQSASIMLSIVDGHDESDFMELLKQNAQYSATGIQASILDKDGVTIATTASVSALPEYNDSAVIAAVSTGTAAFRSNIKQTDEVSGLVREWMCYANPVTINQQDYIIYVRTDIGQIMRSIANTKQVIFLSILIAMSIACIVGTIFANTITSPITSLTNKTKELAKGHFDVAMPPISNDEIGQLALHFSHMASELDTTMSAISSEKKKLEVVLHNMTDGVLAFNTTGSLIHANLTSVEMLELPEDTMSLTIDQITTFFGMPMGVLENGEPGQVQELNRYVGDKYIKASFVPYTGSGGQNEGVVIVLQDMTEQKRLEEMRKEFVANVSHEIRTPLTTIKSYAETLLLGAIDERETAMDFLATIDSEADRMTVLVQDLLVLSRMDSGKVKLDIKQVNLRDLIKENAEAFMLLAEKNNQQLVISLCPNDYVVHVDKDRMGQVLTNILSNAIKYSKAHTAIYLNVAEDSQYYRIIVKDNGIGIPKEDIERIFERFYRVDKTRSREMGGTGLGLAIAKEMMEAHGGKILVKSAAGDGTQVTICIPKIVTQI